MKKIIGAVIVGLFGFSLDAMCGYEPLKEENNNQHPKSGSASSEPKYEDPMIKRLQAAYSQEDFQKITQWAIDDLAEQEREEEEKRKREEKFKEFVDHLRAQQQQRDLSPRTPTAVAH